MVKNHIEYKVLPRKVKKLIDLESPEFLDRNPDVKARMTTAPDGTKGVFRFQGDEKIAPIDIGERFSMNDYSHFCFKVYSEKATGTKIRLKLDLVADNDRYIQGGVCGYAMTINFTGWKEFRILRDHLTVAYPPPFFTSISMQTDGSGMNSNIPENVLYFTTVTAEREQLEVISNGIDLSSAEPYEQILKNFDLTMIGPPDSWYTPQQQKRVESNINDCRNFWAELKETWCDGEKGKLFNCDIQRVPWKDEPRIMQMYHKLLMMTYAYSRPNDVYYQNKELLEDIKKALEYMYTHYFGENLYTSTIYGNWWHWDIGIPQEYLGILIMLRHELGYELTAKYANTVKFLMPFPYGAGSNKLNMAKLTLMTAALLHDAEYICLTKHFTMNDLDYFTDKFGGDGGFYEDGSFIQHTEHPYTRAYGIDCLGGIIALMFAIQGTPFEFTEKVYFNQFRWIFENYRHQMFKTNFSACTGGRGVTRGNSEINTLKLNIGQIVAVRAYAPDEIKPKLDSLIRTMMHNLKDDLSYRVSPVFIKYCVDLYNDDSVPFEEPYLVTRVFTRMARIAHHGEKFGAALAMSSDTIHKYESINKDNEQGWYFSDGFLFVYPYNTEYEFGKEFFQHASPYLRPATTVNLAERKAINTRSYANASSHAGGVEFGKYGSAAFVLKYRGDIMNHGTHFDIKDAAISANKSYFFFDDEIVCLGSAIKDISGKPVITCVDNRLWTENDVFTAEGKALVPNEKTELDAKYAHFTNMGGYVFLDGEKLSAKKSTCKNFRNENDESTADFLELCIEHGTGNESLNGSYAYAYLPTASAENTAKYSECPDVKIISLTDTVHAVYKEKLDIWAVNFYAGGTVKLGALTVKAESPCCVMISGSTLAVCDPTKYQQEIALTVSANGKETAIKANTADSMGKTFVFSI